MRSKMLKDMAKEKSGWRPKAIVDAEIKKPQNDRCMVTNGTSSKLVIVEGADSELDSLLEKRVMKEIRDLVAKDNEIMLRETIIFSAIAQASVTQAQTFVPLVKQEAKAS